MTLLSHYLTTHANRGEVSPANPIRGMSSTRVGEFLRMNPPEFYSSNVGEDRNVFIYEVYEVLQIMRQYFIEKQESTSYQLTDVHQLLYE